MAKKTLSDTSILARLVGGFAALVIIIIGAVLLNVSVTSQTKNTTHNVVTIDIPAYAILNNLTGEILYSQNILQRYIITGDPQYKNRLSNLWTVIKNYETKLDSYLIESVYLNKWNEIKILTEQLIDSQHKVLSAPNTKESNIIFTNETIPIMDKILNTADGRAHQTATNTIGLIDIFEQALKKHAQKTLTDVTTIQRIEYFLIFIIIVASSIIAYLTAKSIVTPIREAITIAKNIAAGERNININTKQQNETGQLLNALSTMQSAITTNEKKLEQSRARSEELFNNIVTIAKMYSQHSAQVAHGDLTTRVEVPNIEEMQQLGQDLNQMTDSLANVTKQITDASQHMLITMEEVKHAIEVQSSGATEQASSINQITASIEEIEKSSTQTINKAKTLGQIAEKTKDKGKEGLNAVEQSIQGMKEVRNKVQALAQTILELSNQTQQIGDITNVVTKLAQQSKMLALNASIEAAKAGEAGKGFAVVAAEVKNLAEQSEESTTQVQKILEDIRLASEKAVLATEEGTKGVDQGTILVEKTGEIVRSLTDVIHETTLASHQIEAAIRQEGIGIEQINAGMNEINQVTSSFVTSVKETTEAIDNLSSVAKNLKKYIDIYKV